MRHEQKLISRLILFFMMVLAVLFPCLSCSHSESRLKAEKIQSIADSTVDALEVSLSKSTGPADINQSLAQSEIAIDTFQAKWEKSMDSLHAQLTDKEIAEINNQIRDRMKRTEEMILKKCPELSQVLGK